jgi:hypothetical protein
MKTFTRVVFVLVVLAFAWFFLLAHFGYRTNEALGALTVGWVNFLKRSFRETTINWNGVLMVLICSAVVAAILWRLVGKKKMGAVFAGFGLLFILTMASAGFFTKAREIFFSDEPRLVRGISEGKSDLRREAMVLRFVLVDAKDLADARNLLAEGGDRNIERVQVALFNLGSTNSEKRFTAMIVPREQRYLDALGFIVTGPSYAVSFPKEFLLEVGRALNQLETNSWPGDFRSFLDGNISKSANQRRRDAPGFEIQ